MSRGRGQPNDLSALSELAPELAEMLVSLACDIALVLDDGGVIRTVAVGTEAVSNEACSWVGQHWADTFTGETRVKAAEVLDDLAAKGLSRLRHLNHASTDGSEIPIAYTAVRLGEQGPTLAVGRDMRVVAAMQERLLQAQHDIERDHWQRRQAETRYRLLFQFANEPALILDAITFEVIDANRAATALWALPSEQIVGAPATDLVEPEARAPLCELLVRARMSDRVVEGATRLASTGESFAVSATAFEMGSTNVLVLRAHPRPTTVHASTEETLADAIFSGLIKRTSDAIVIVDDSGQIALANRAFRELVPQTATAHVIGRPLLDWFADGADALDAILAEVGDSGCVRLARARFKRENSFVDVEFSATAIVGGNMIGLIIRIAHAQDMPVSAPIHDPERNVH